MGALNFVVFLETTGHNAPLKMPVNGSTDQSSNVVRF
jgi:hypothetical protein